MMQIVLLHPYSWVGLNKLKDLQMPFDPRLLKTADSEVCECAHVHICMLTFTNVCMTLHVAVCVCVSIIAPSPAASPGS